MKSLRSLLLVSPLILCLLPILPAPSPLEARTGPAQGKDELTLAAARTAIGEMYDAWGRARVEIDKATLDSIMAPDFYVLMEGRKISREKFLGDITTVRTGYHLTRFDADILTVQRTEKGWTAVITEKLELTIPAAGGVRAKVCSFWVTRDGWRKDGDKWLVTFSEAIGFENWNPGEKPPLKNW